MHFRLVFSGGIILMLIPAALLSLRKYLIDCRQRKS